MADPFAPILTSGERRNPVELPEDPTEEELARDWALCAEDRKEALRLWSAKNEKLILGKVMKIHVEHGASR